MKLIIAGGRDFTDYNLLEKEVNNLRKIYGIEEVVCGEARGADTLGKLYAIKHGIPVVSMPADWNKYGRYAGLRRNTDMAKISTHCICFWDGKSRGTKDMIQKAKDYCLIQRIVRYTRGQN